MLKPRRRGLRAAVCAVLAAAGLTVAASSSSAAITTVSETHTFPCIPFDPPVPGTCQGGLSATLTPQCPPNQKVVGGGFWVDVVRITAPVVWESHRVGNGWRVTTFELDTRAAGDFTAYAYCAPVSAAIVEVTSAPVTISGPRGSWGTAIATCPTGTRPISGGWSGSQASYAGASLIRRSDRRANTWTVSAVKANEAGVNPQLVAHAYCAATKSLTAKVATKKILKPAVGTRANMGSVDTPACLVPTGTGVSLPGTSFAAGGFRLAPPGTFPTTLNATSPNPVIKLPLASYALAFLSELRRNANDGWGATAIIYSGDELGVPTPDWNLTALAYCGSEPQTA